MSKKRLDDEEDNLRVTCVIHDVERYQRCTECTSGECRDCMQRQNNKLDVTMCNWLRPKPPFNL